jgi:hypothetical protein
MDKEMDYRSEINRKISKGKKGDDRKYGLPMELFSQAPRTSTRTRMCGSTFPSLDLNPDEFSLNVTDNTGTCGFFLPVPYTTESVSGEIYDALWLKLAQERIEQCTEEFKPSKKRKIELLTSTSTHDYAKENLARLMQNSPTTQISVEKRMSINYVLDVEVTESNELMMIEKD